MDAERRVPPAAPALVRAADALGGLLRDPLWPAQDAQDAVEVLQRLRVACDLPGSPWRLHRARTTPDGVHVLDVSHADARSPRMLADAIALVAAVAGPALLVRQTDAVTIDCATGTLEDDVIERPRGRLVRLCLPDPEERVALTPDDEAVQRVPQPPGAVRESAGDEALAAQA